MMNEIVAIIGPMACGKTRNKDALKEIFKAQRIVEQCDVGTHGGRLQKGDLILTNQKLFDKKHKKGLPKIRYVSWDYILKHYSHLLVGTHMTHFRLDEVRAK